MTVRLTSSVAVPLLAALATSATMAASCPLDTPEGLRAESVAEELTVNGLPMRIRQVRSKASIEEQLEQTSRQWKDEGHAVRRDRVGQWEVLAAGDANCNTTLQLRTHPAPREASERSVGYLGVSEPKRTSKPMPKLPGFQLPGGVEVLTAVSGSDAGRYSHTLTLSSKRAIDDLNDYFARHLSERRWEGIQSHEVRKFKGDAARIISAQKGNERLTLVIWRDDLTRLQLTVAEVP